MAKKSLLFLIALCLTATVALAEVPTDPSGRIQWIQERLDQASAPARVWQYGWTTAYGAMTYLYAAQASTLNDDDEENDRFDAVVNSVTSFTGFVPMLLDPLSTESAARQLRQLPASTDNEKQAKLRRAEMLLKQCAEREKRGRSLLSHALAGLVSVAAGVAVACDDDRTGDGVAMFASSMLVAEIQIFTTPTHATRAWNEYGTGVAQSAMASPLDKIHFSVIPKGLAVTYQF